MNKHKKIYEHLVNACEPLELSMPWGSPRTSQLARQIPENVSALDQGLFLNFPVEELVAAGVMRASDTGDKLQLVPALADPTNLVWPLRIKAGAAPYDVVVADGCLSRRNLPMVAAMCDYGTRQRLQSGVPLMVCGSLADSVLLAELGLPTTIAAGLESLGGDHLDQVCKSFGWPRQLDRDASAVAGGGQPPHMETSDGPAKRTIVLVAWEPSKGNAGRAADFDNLRAHFDQLRQTLRIDIPQIQVWMPNSSLPNLRFVRVYGNQRELTRVFLESFTSDSSPLFLDLVPPEFTGPTLASAYTAMAEQDALTPDLSKRQRDFARQLDQEVVAPLLSLADYCEDPVKRAKLFNLASMSGLMNRLSLPLLGRMGQSNRQTGPELTQDLRCVDAMLKVSTQHRQLAADLTPREVKECRGKRS